jgi:hypothetical protein
MTKEQAKDLAHQECLRQGWPWEEPVSVQWGIWTYWVWTSATTRGGNASITVRKRDGQIVSAGFIPY